MAEDLDECHADTASSGRRRRRGRRRVQADAGDRAAARRLAELLAERGDLDGAASLLCASADAGDMPVAWRLAELLAKRGDIDESRAVPTLPTGADPLAD